MQPTKGQQTRQAIVEKAAPLFNKKGFEATSLSDLMVATGLQKGGIYRHFAGKEELATAAFDYAWAKAVSERLQGVEHVPDCVDRLKKMVDNFVLIRADLVPGGCPLMNTAVEADDGNPLLRARAQQALLSWTERLSETVFEGIKKRQIRRGVDALNLAQRIIASLEGALLISRLNGSRAALHDMREYLNEYLEQEIRSVRARTADRRKVSRQHL
jgi:TetR/AcrR family transcriptional regulator, transcriptional repressor for nem operon